MIDGGIDPAQLAQLRAELKKRNLPPKKRQRLLWRMAKQGVIAAAKRHQRQQVSPDGQAWEPRKRGKKKMLTGLPRLLAVREIPEQGAVMVYLRSQGGKKLSAGALGYIHDTGANITVRADDIPSRRQGDELATRWQAKRLRQLGFKRREGKRLVNASASWIMQTMRRAQAGAIIRTMSGTPPVRVWKIELPARVFLGVSDEEFNNIMARQLQAIDFGWQVSAQDIRGKTS